MRCKWEVLRNMKTRLASVDYLTFLQCYKYNLWGANSTFISKWKVGDQLVFKVDKKLVAVAEITGEAYMDNVVIWSNGLFWNRVPLKFTKVLRPMEGIDFEEYLKPHFLELWGKKYGWVILNKHPLPDEITDIIMNAFKSKEDSSTSYIDIDNMISEKKLR